jgi:hypothetical protein
MEFFLPYVVKFCQLVMRWYQTEERILGCNTKHAQWTHHILFICLWGPSILELYCLVLIKLRTKEQMHYFVRSTKTNLNLIREWQSGCITYRSL